MTKQSVLLSSSNKFVIPEPSRFMYSSISSNDKALCYIINRGYFEDDDLSAVKVFNTGVETRTKGDLKLVGDIDKIKLRTGNVVYRQRVYFRNVGKLLQLLGHFTITLEIPESYRVGIEHVVKCSKALPSLWKYYQDKKGAYSSIEEWLTCASVAQLYAQCILNNVKIETYIPSKKLFSQGCLVRAPYLSYYMDVNKRKSSVFVASDDMFKQNYKGSLFSKEGMKYKGYSTLVGSDIGLYGFTFSNLVKDGLRKGKINGK